MKRLPIVIILLIIAAHCLAQIDIVKHKPKVEINPPIDIENLELPNSESSSPPSSEIIDITGVYHANDGGYYYVRQVVNTVYWYGEHANGSFANVFKGTISGHSVTAAVGGRPATIRGTFYDLPNGRASGSGDLVLNVRNNVITKVSGGFGATEFRLVEDGTNEPMRFRAQFSNTDYDHIWRCNDGGRYAMRAVGNTLVWFGQKRDRESGNILFANVGFGTISGDNISIEWADVPKDHTQSYRGKGTMSLQKSGNEIRKIESTSGSGFGGSIWTLGRFIRAESSTELDCNEVENLGNALRSVILTEVNHNIAGTRYENLGPFNRKTLIIHRAKSVSFSNCTLKLELEATLKRSGIRRDAEGTITLKANVYRINFSSREVCVNNVRVDDVRLSHTTNIGEAVYRLVANETIPDNACYR